MVTKMIRQAFYCKDLTPHFCCFFCVTELRPTETCKQRNTHGDMIIAAQMEHPGYMTALPEANR